MRDSTQGTSSQMLFPALDFKYIAYHMFDKLKKGIGIRTARNGREFVASTLDGDLRATCFKTDRGASVTISRSDGVSSRDLPVILFLVEDSGDPRVYMKIERRDERSD